MLCHPKGNNELVLIEMVVSMVSAARINPYHHRTLVGRAYMPNTACPAIHSEYSSIWAVLRDESHMVKSSHEVMHQRQFSLLMQRSPQRGLQGDIQDMPRPGRKDNIFVQEQFSSGYCCKSDAVRTQKLSCCRR